MTPNLATSNKSEFFPIRQTLRYMEWTMIAVFAIIVAFNSWAGQSFVSEITTYLCLSAFALLSLFFPVDRSPWQRRAYVALGIIVLLPTRALTGWNVEPLLCPLLIKSCFLLNRRDVLITVITAGVAWQLFAIPGNQLFQERRDQEHLYQHLHPEQTFVSRAINDTGIYIAFGTFVVLFGFSLLSEQESRKRAIALTQQMEVLAATLERTRIAHDIHDSLGHTLTTLDVQLSLSQRAYRDNPNQSLQALNTAKDLASQSLTEVRCALRTMNEKTFDLHQALLTLTEQVQQGQSFEIHVDTNLPQLPSPIAYQIYRIIQEGLTNIQKHAQATSIYLGGKVAAHYLTVELVDNGRGFNAQAVHTGFGLRGMRERAMLLRGQLDIESAPNQGTRIYITIPL
jgi:signal transduction histidine kinase